MERMSMYLVNGSLETNYMFSQTWAIGPWLHHDITVSGNAYQLVCSSREAHDLPCPVQVARIVEYWIEMYDFVYHIDPV